jgi:hypothetical protein
MNLKVWETLFQKVLHPFKLNTPEKPQAQHSQKVEDLLAFRTITTILHFLQSESNQYPTTPARFTKEDRNDLRVLDALSAILIRQHEIVAVVARPYNGSNLNVQVIASVVSGYPSNTNSLPSFRKDPWVPEELVTAVAAGQGNVRTVRLLEIFLKTQW